MKTLALAILLSACALQATHAADAVIDVDAYCPLYELYPYPPDYIYFCHYYNPAGDCSVGKVDAYDIWYYPVVPYTSCDDCRDPAILADGKKAAAKDAVVPPQKPHPKFGGLPDPIDEDFQYELPRGPDFTGPDGVPDGIGDAKQYGTATSIIQGRTRIAQFTTPDGRGCFFKVFQLTLRLQERDVDNQKRLKKGGDAKPLKDPASTVIYLALELPVLRDGYPTNATLIDVGPGPNDESDPCYLFIGKCKMDGEDDEQSKPITILTVKRR